MQSSSRKDRSGNQKYDEFFGTVNFLVQHIVDELNSLTEPMAYRLAALSVKIDNISAMASALEGRLNNDQVSRKQPELKSSIESDAALALGNNATTSAIGDSLSELWPDGSLGVHYEGFPVAAIDQRIENNVVDGAAFQPCKGETLARSDVVEVNYVISVLSVGRFIE
ncbi:hypothetical protein TTRE_0000401201 [Trichuris trichiura]|uniref:Uncharacterized protein n=1 Tax=Trichuris trichiura TaxID=36087 RepID=A0A077Z7J4_TRITR|nr:hypothetical protein TTRE_0000401201 [Trichuris trichiura]